MTEIIEKEKIGFLSFPDIELFHNIVKAIEVYPHIAPEPVKYRGKIKCHGTNAAIRLLDGEVAAQSRSSLITPDNDNNNFAKWVEANKVYWANVSVVNAGNITVYGEWCGKGIQKGVAISQIPNKVFAVFAIMIGKKIDYTIETNEPAMMITDPVKIEAFLGNKPSDVHVLPWEGEEFTINFADRASLEPIVQMINSKIESIEPCDPWVKSVFGVEGTAEGIVYYPGAGKMVTRKYFSDLTFKAKGEKHKVVKTKQAVQIDPEVAKSVGEFVELFATENRFEQGLAAIGGSTEMKNIGPFLAWLGKDVEKESVDELAASGLEWHQVQKNVQAKARNWFIAKNRTL